MNERRARLAVVAFFAVYLAVGIAIHADYGASWDEPVNRGLGSMTFRYIETRWSESPPPWSQISKGLVAAQGPFFETILVAVERLFGVEDQRAVLRMRHLATFLAFWLGAIAYYDLLRRRFGDRKTALLGVSLLVLTPRLFAHSFYNSKDAVLTALFIVGTLTMVRFLRDKSLVSSLVHAVACAAAIGVRAVGFLLTAVTLGLLLLQLGQPGIDRRVRRRSVAAAGIHLLLLAAFTVLFWPALWENPVAGFLDAIQRQRGSKVGDSLYLGTFVEVDRLPWHYLPVWILITLPVPYVLLFVAGLWGVGRRLVKESWFSVENTQNLMFLSLFFVPLLAVIVVRPVLYDDWRHLYFITPALLAIALTGVRELAARPHLRRAVGTAVFATVVYGASILIRYHPYQNVYFNPLAGGHVDERFELDYWGLSFREGLEFVVRTDPGETIAVSVSDFPGLVSSSALASAQRDRLRFGRIENATYFLSIHRRPDHYAAFRARRYPYVNEVYAVRVAGATLLGVYKIR